MYFVEGSDKEEKKYKFSSKGIQKDKNDITKERFQNVLNDPKYKDVCIYRGFRVMIQKNTLNLIKELLDYLK